MSKFLSQSEKLLADPSFLIKKNVYTVAKVELKIAYPRILNEANPFGLPIRRKYCLFVVLRLCEAVFGNN